MLQLTYHNLADAQDCVPIVLSVIVVSVFSHKFYVLFPSIQANDNLLLKFRQWRYLLHN